jgi:hypothetical protein
MHLLRISLIFPAMFFVLHIGCASWKPLASLSPAEKAKREFCNASLIRHATFRAQPGWEKMIYEDPEVLATLSSSNARATPKIVVSLGDQRALLLANGLVAMDFPVATGTRSHPTPIGSFRVLEKKKKHSSNLYGKIVDASGNVVIGSADSRRDVPPEGGAFIGTPMPFWMRITDTGVGLHVGHLPGRPASHGCIRMPRAVAPKIYSHVPIGTEVEIVEVFVPNPAPVQPRA